MAGIINRHAIAALAAVAVLSCEQAEVDLGAPTSDVLVFSSEEVISEVPSKTHWTGEGLEWSAGDKIAITYNSSGVWGEAFYLSDALQQDCQAAEFYVPMQVETSGKNIRFHALYPASIIAGDFTSAPNVTVSIPSEQIARGDSFDSSADLMSARSVNVYSSVPSASIPLLWTRLVAHAQISIKLPQGVSLQDVRSVVFTADDSASLAGSYSLDLTDYSLTPVDAKNSLTIKVDEAAGTDGLLRVWAAFVPSRISSMSFTIETDESIYEKTVAGVDLDFKANVRSVLSVDMSAAQAQVHPNEEYLDQQVNRRVFDMLDLDRSGMSKVKDFYQSGRYYMAAKSLLEYWRGSRPVVNPNVNLSQTTYNSGDKQKADMALKESGYRFYVKNYDFQSFSDGTGGIDWTKELQGEDQFNIQKHRHQWVLPQAKVYWGTKDEKYIQSFMEVYSSWLAAHPCPVLTSGTYVIPSSDPLRDMWTDLQATSRTMDQISVLDYYIDSESMTPAFLTHFLAAYADAVECIRANPYNEPLSNHRLYEIQAVFTAAVMMPEFRNASQWLSEASEDIGNQIRVQFAQDGVLVEMDPSYHISMVAIFYDTHKVAAVNDMLSYFPSDFTTYLHKAVHFVRDLAYPDYGIEDFNDVRSTSWTRSTLTKNFTKYFDMFPQDKTLQYWASGHTAGTAPEEYLSIYPVTGWYMLRNGWTKSSTMLVLKNNYNDRGDGKIWWHCQPDNGTVSLYHNGRRFLPDAGSYTYTNGSVRDAFRATAMHNTLTKNLETIADSRMRGEYVASGENNDYSYVHVKNQSYGNLRHERVVFMVKDRYYVVADAALGSAVNTSVELSWHLCPGNVQLDSYGSDAYGCHTAFSDGNNMMFKTFCFSGEKGIVPDADFVSSSGTSYTSNEINVKSERSYYRTAVNIGASNTPVRFLTVILPISDYSSAPSVSAEYISPTQIKVSVSGEEIVLTY